MRSPTLLRNSRSFFKASALAHPVICSCPRPRSSRNEQSSQTALRLYGTRNLSTSSSAIESTPPPSAPSIDVPESSSNDVPEQPDDEHEKPKQRRTRLSSTKDSDIVQLPDGLDILWIPEALNSEKQSPRSAALPPPEIFQEVLNHLHITLHPQTQHRASYASPVLIEPTLALYCPIEGGEYIIDSTVRELAQQTEAEILVLDAVQLAAGEWGHFGKAANVLQLPRNPLHFSSSQHPSASNSRSFPVEDEEDDSDAPPQLLSSNHQMTLVMTPPTLHSRTLMASPTRRNLPPSKAKVFFDTLINLPSKEQESLDTPLPRSRPRLVYIRDFTTLAPSSPTWYPPLLSAVRQRRRGPISRPTSPIANPMTIIFGMTPSLTPPVSQAPSSAVNAANRFMNRNAQSAQVTPAFKLFESDWSEGKAAEKAREKRLRRRLRKWERDDTALHAEFPKLATNFDGGGGGGEHRSEILIIGSPDGNSGFPPMIGSETSGGGGNRGSESDSNSPFFRTSILVPSVRSLAEERAHRMARRREINELTMRMGVGAVGGVLEKNDAATELSKSLPEVDNDADGLSSGSEGVGMWDVWGKSVEVWSDVRQVADRAVGSAVTAQRTSSNLEKTTLDPTAVTWSAVHQSWAAYRSLHERRKRWMKESSPLDKHEQEEEEGEEGGVEREVDEVVERVKNDSDLDSHEMRLLPCIVDPVSISTSFNHVHLPAHTIDSVRTIVSLPLLHPSAFQQGILKEHAMSGCLLFGPPGTGKTLIVRALAKEAGCRMMAISPSDVMDMYVGEGEKLVRAVFSLARKLSPCVIFLDEIDALFGARMSARESGGAYAHRGVITEFMQEMDGLKSSNDDSIVVIGATNRPFDLDDAVLRRLPRRLLVDLPGGKEREEILKILLRDEVLALDVNIKALVKATEGFSGSDLKHLCVSAALDAVKESASVPWSPLPTIPKPTPTGSPVGVITLDAPSAPTATESVPMVQMAVDSLAPLPSENLPETRSNIHTRTLHLRNFTKALKEITPSSSEALGSLVELRKWNEEFGEGRKEQRRQHVWGKDRFGFTDKTSEEGRVVLNSSNSDQE